MRLVEAKIQARDLRENPRIFEQKTAPGHSLNLHEADHPIPGEPRPLQPQIRAIFRISPHCLQKTRVGGPNIGPALPVFGFTYVLYVLKTDFIEVKILVSDI